MLGCEACGEQIVAANVERVLNGADARALKWAPISAY
jgi:hypothetical protein